jgi:hypothetical protein
LTCDVLVSFVEEDAETAQAILERLEHSGWSCRGAAAATADAPLEGIRRALVILISRHAAASASMVRYVERAAGRDVPILPVRLDDTPLSKSLDYFVGTIGAIRLARVGPDVASQQICDALSRRLANAWAYGLAATRDRRPEVSDEFAPPFRAQTLLRRVIFAGLAVISLLGLTGFGIDIFWICGGPLLPVHQSARLSGLIGGLTAFTATFWLYRAYRNLITLGAAPRFRRVGAIWRLMFYPVNMVTAGAVIRDLIDSTLVVAGWRQRQLLAWAWPALTAAVSVHTWVGDPSDRGWNPSATIWWELGANLIQMYACRQFFQLAEGVSQRQAAAHARRLYPRMARAASVPRERHRRVLVSGAPQDRSAAEAICQALEAQHVECWLARRDQSWSVEAVDRFDGLVLVLSANLEACTFKEAERAVARGMVVIPFRVDHHPVPPAVRDLIGSIHWIDDQGIGFGAQIEMAHRALEGAVGARAGGAAEDEAAERYRTREESGRTVKAPARFWRIAFYVAAQVCGGVASLSAVTYIFVAMAGVTTALNPSPAQFLFFSLARMGGLLLCIGLFYLWRRSAGAAETVHSWLWPGGLVVAAVAGCGSPAVQARYGMPVASAMDLAVSIFVLVAIGRGMRMAMEAEARRRREQPGAAAAAELQSRGAADRVRFANNTSWERWFALTILMGGLAAIILTGVDAENLKLPPLLIALSDRVRHDLIMSLSLHVLFAMAPASLLFLAWLGLAWRNAAALGLQTLHVTMTGAVLTFANPLVNTYLAAPVVRELSGGGGPEARGKPGRLVSFWWGSVLLYWASLWCRFGANVNIRPGFLLWCDAVAGALYVTAAVLTYRVVAEVNRIQNGLFERW